MKDIPETPIEWAVARAWDNAQSNEDACEALLAMMERDPELYRLIMQPNARTTAMARVCAFKRAERAAIWHRPSDPDRRVHLLARSNRLSLLDLRLPSGKRLGDATKIEVLEAAQTYDDLAASNESKAVWLKRIAKKMPDTGAVQDVLNAQELEDLK
jgi:hypothetical protein